MTNGSDSTDLDLDEVRARYREERDKRLVEDRDRMLELTGDLAQYLEDPYTEAVAREPVTDDEVDAVIVGGGFGGLLQAAYLRKAGVKRIRLIERAGDVGGVWYWNRYPGAMCDVQSYIYLPMLEETGYVPTQKYSLQPEIYGYAKKLAEQFDVYPLALFQTAVTGAEWDEESARWTITTDRGDVLRTRYFLIANGSFTTLKLPSIPGIETFGGKMFHTSRWDYDYTGGSSDTPLTKLGDKKVAVIGTGATAIQVVPPVARAAEKLIVVQRTPSTVWWRGNGPTEPDWAETRTPGWQRIQRDNFTLLTAGIRQPVDLTRDGWTEAFQQLAGRPEFNELSPEERAAELEKIDLAWMEGIRARVDEIVKDKAKAEALKPYYRYNCKRPAFHDEYLDAFNRDNVDLVNAPGGIDRITEKGLVIDGVEYEVDCIVFATGFDSESPYTDRIGFDVIGREGQRLSKKWEDGFRTLHGAMTHGFPNFFFNPANNMQGTATVNLIHVLEDYAIHFSKVITELDRRGVRAFDPAQEEEDAWVERIMSTSRLSAAFLEQCTPGRWNNEGHLDDRSARNANYPNWNVPEFFKILDDWRDTSFKEQIDRQLQPS